MIVPVVVPLIMMLTPGKASPLLSFTTPFTVKASCVTSSFSVMLILEDVEAKEN